MSTIPERPRPRRALIVDDDAVLRIAIQHFIARLGFETRVVDNGQAAVEAFAEHGADIILLDGAMPIMDGFAACEAIRALPRGRHVPVIMITVFEDDGSVDRAFTCGANEYITKPIHWAVLRNRIHQLVDAAYATRQLRNDRAFFQSLVDAIPDPTLVCDSDGVVRWINASARACPLVQTPAIDTALQFAAGVEVPTTGDVDPDAVVADIRAQIVASNAPLNLLLHQRASEGSEHYAEVHVRALRGVEGENFGLILRVHDVTDRELEGRRLRSEVTHFGKLAHHDSLTGLANRRLFEDHLAAAVNEADRSGEHLALMFLDLDGFKAVNDSLGHDSGDLVLRITAARLTEQVRRSDTVARLGGDEFAILLRHITDIAAVASLGERILASLCQPMDLTGNATTISASIGVALLPQDTSNAAALIKSADGAMYAVKQSGKRGVRFAGAG